MYFGLNKVSIFVSPSWEILFFFQNIINHNLTSCGFSLIFSNSIWKPCLWNFIFTSSVYFISVNFRTKCWMILLFYSSILTSLTWCPWDAIYFIVASLVLPTLVFISISCLIFNRFASFSLFVLRTQTFPDWLLFNSALNWHTILIAWCCIWSSCFPEAEEVLNLSFFIFL